MKDCASCEHSAENSPGKVSVSWRRHPCSRCAAVEPMGGTVVFMENIHSQATIQPRPSRGHQSEVREQLARFMFHWMQLTEKQQSVVYDRLVNPEHNLSDIARSHRVSRQAVSAIITRIRCTFPMIGELL